MFEDIINDDKKIVKIKVYSRRLNRYGKEQLKRISYNSGCLPEAWDQVVKLMSEELGKCYEYIKKLEDKQ